MKYSLIAAVVLLALAQGSFVQGVDLEHISQYFEDLKAKATQELTRLVDNHDLANQAQTFLADSKTQLEPLASQVQEQVKTAATAVEEQIRPLATTVQAQLQPIIDDFKKQMEDIFQRMAEHGRAIGQ